MTDNEEVTTFEKSSKKRKSFGRMQDVMKKLRLCSHETGPDCKCLKLECFKNISVSERNDIISKFNQIQSHEKQSMYLCGLILSSPVARHRPRKPESEADFHTFSYSYKVRVVRNEQVSEIPVCYKAFLSLHGITAKRLQNLQKSLKTTGLAPLDMRGKHNSMPNKLPDDVVTSAIEHIQSFKSRKSHYGLAKSKKRYLPEELNVCKMFSFYKKAFPNNKMSLEKYREIFNTNFNLSFGYPRCDTCSTCDEFTVKIESIQSKLSLPTITQNEASKLSSELKILLQQKELHLRKADSFYKLKKKAKLDAQKDKTKEAIAMDYQKNLPLPNISTNDVYYRRQLSLYMFNIHQLSNSEAIFYTYAQIYGKKGGDEVCSMLWDFIFNHLDSQVKELTIFCDSCSGQNKNYAMFRMLHYIVHYTKRLETITMVFPIRGHSYLECDKNMGLVNQKSVVELPSEWNEVLENSRSKPTPFKVISCENQEIFRSWTTFLSPLYTKMCPFKTRPVRQLKIVRHHPRMILHRQTYNGKNEESVVIKPKRKQISLPEGCFHLPELAYDGPIPISKAKFDDIQHLKKFCSVKAQKYFEALPHL